MILLAEGTSTVMKVLVLKFVKDAMKLVKLVLEVHTLSVYSAWTGIMSQVRTLALYVLITAKPVQMAIAVTLAKARYQENISLSI